MSIVTRKPWSAGELNRLPEGWRYEIDEGELVIMAPAGFEHGRLVIRIGKVLSDFVEGRRLGAVVGGESGFFLRRNPDTLRAPDVAFFSNDRLSRITNRKGFPDVPADLAVEVQDPSEPDLARKIDQYLAAGVRAVWVVAPVTHTVTRYSLEKEPQTWASPDALVEEPVLPGFSCRLDELFGEY